MSLLDPDTLRRLPQSLEAKGVDELDVTVGTWRLYLRREPGVVEVMVPQGVVDSIEHEGIPIVAPLGGVFYSRPKPDEPAYASAGSPVEVGQVVALIETMKMFNEVIAEVAGEVIEVAVQDRAEVQAGQPLIYVRPHREGEDR